MARPQKDRLVNIDPRINYFKPRGVPMIELEQVQLTVDELEALRLADLMGMSHEEAGKQMGVSRATFGRIVEGGNYKRIDPAANRLFLCERCKWQWEEPRGTGRPKKCPSCGCQELHRMRARE
jgi:predicted DNA-binding protein (UPF0251 family)